MARTTGKTNSMEAEKIKTSKINEQTRLPPILPQLKTSLAVDHDIFLYLMFYLAGAAGFITYVRIFAYQNGNFQWPQFLGAYFVLVYMVTKLEIAIAFTHRERHFGRTATLVKTSLFILTKIPLLFLFTILRFLLDWLIVACVVGMSIGSEFFGSKNIVGIWLGLIIIYAFYLLWLIADSLAGRFVRFGLPVAVYNSDKSIGSVIRLTGEIFHKKTKETFLAEFSNEWIAFGVFVAFLIALPIIDTFKGSIDSKTLITVLGIFISGIYLVRLSFVLVYCEFVAEKN
jgi:hypothetical protein